MMLKFLKAVLIDLSGTIHIEDKPTPGAINALKRLRQAKNLKIKFVTNTSKESRQSLLDRLTRIGFDINKDEVFTSLTAARKLIEDRQLRPFYILSEDSLRDFEGIPCYDPNAVVVGLAPDAFEYERMTLALRLLLSGAPLIAINKSRYYKRTDGLAIGAGAYVAALEFSAGTQAEVVGKPQKSFFLSALSDMDCKPEEALMIGDDARDDVQGAMDCGICGMLVKTGKYRDGDETKISRPPDYLENSFSAAVDTILKE